MKSLDELTTRCIRCGFCLESCPTFVETGEETESPRGRIYLVRSADEGRIGWEQTRPHLDCCLGCRACETACPSGVEYGQILEVARDRLERERKSLPREILLDSLSNPARVRTQLALGNLLPGRRIPGFVSRMLSGVRPEVDKPQAQTLHPWPEMEESHLPAVRGEVFLLEGCVMRVLFPAVHQATRRLLRRVGYVVRDTPAGCCGSLHAHSGSLDDAREHATNLIEAFAGDLPVIVDSAGCGSTMKEYPALLDGDPEAEAFSKRVFDISEFLLAKGLAQHLRSAPGVAASATYHDACHLAHGQGVRMPPRQLLDAVPGLSLIPLPEADMCCGSAGIYNLLQPKMARALLERKWKNVEATRAEWVILGNPGCHAWIAQAAREQGGRVRVLHTTEALEAAFSGLT